MNADNTGAFRPRRARIVCTDDDAVVREVLKAVLTRAGHEVYATDSGRRAVELADKHRPDLILLDLSREDEDGFATFEELRRLPGHARTPILFLSGSTDEEDVARCMEMGAADYISKPIAPGLLRAKVEFFLERDRRPSLTESQTRALASSPLEVMRASAQSERLFDKYILLDEVGSGRVGYVMRAWDTALRDYVALKFVRPGVSDEEVESLYNEARHVIRLAHDHIVRVHDIRETDGRHFYAMQYIDGQPADRKHVPDEAARIVAQVAHAVEHAHQRGIVHRDIKPLNILLDADGKAWVSDFGIAVAVSGGEVTHVTRAGSPSYMAPEQTGLVDRPVTPLVDVWSLGATLYHLLTGTAPFMGTSTEDILEAVAHDELVPPSRYEPGLPPSLERICMRAMRKDPAERFQSAAELARVLERAKTTAPHRIKAWLLGE